MNPIIRQVLGNTRCSKLLSGDGITTSDLTLKGMLGIFDMVSVDTRFARKIVPAIGEAASAAKNLDEYQFLICSKVPSLPDSDKSKIRLQKYRVTIIAALARLAGLLRECGSSPVDLSEWSRHARSLLEETSLAYRTGSGPSFTTNNRQEMFDFFGVPENEIDAALRRCYSGQE